MCALRAADKERSRGNQADRARWIDTCSLQSPRWMTSTVGDAARTGRPLAHPGRIAERRAASAQRPSLAQRAHRLRRETIERSCRTRVTCTGGSRSKHPLSGTDACRPQPLRDVCRGEIEAGSVQAASGRAATDGSRRPARWVTCSGRASPVLCVFWRVALRSRDYRALSPCEEGPASAPA